MFILIWIRRYIILEEESKGKKMIQLKEGDYRIKIVGKDTKGHINLSIEIGRASCRERV